MAADPVFRIARGAADLQSACGLINDLYGRRNYGSDHIIPGGTTFVAEQGGQVLGTVTLVVKDAQVCELVRLASVGRSKDVLAGLFSLAFQHGTSTCACSELRIEVSPRHVAFYQAMLGFEPVGPRYTNPEVNVPAQLMRIDVATITRCIRDRPARTLFAHFPEPEQETADAQLHSPALHGARQRYG